VGGSRSTRREPTHTRGEHADSTQKGFLLLVNSYKWICSFTHLLLLLMLCNPSFLLFYLINKGTDSSGIDPFRYFPPWIFASKRKTHKYTCNRVRSKDRCVLSQCIYSNTTDIPLTNHMTQVICFTLLHFYMSNKCTFSLLDKRQTKQRRNPSQNSGIYWKAWFRSEHWWWCCCCRSKSRFFFNPLVLSVFQNASPLLF